MQYSVDTKDCHSGDVIFTAAELDPDSVAETISDLVYVGAVPFIRFAQKMATRVDQAAEYKEIFLQMMRETLDGALKIDGPIGDAINVKEGNRLYLKMEQLYYTWLEEIGFSTTLLKHDFKDFTFEKLTPYLIEWFSVSMQFRNKQTGELRLLPLSTLLDFEEKSETEIKQQAAECLLIAVVVLDKLNGTEDNSLRQINISDFEEEMMEAVRKGSNWETIRGQNATPELRDHFMDGIK